MLKFTKSTVKHSSSTSTSIPHHKYSKLRTKTRPQRLHLRSYSQSQNLISTTSLSSKNPAHFISHKNSPKKSQTKLPLVNKHQKSHKSINILQSSKRSYDIPHYVGYRNAFSDQLHLYASKDKTPISLYHFLNWPINHLPAYSTQDHETLKKLKETEQQQNLDKFRQKSKPVLDVNNLNEQMYNAEYQAKIIENAQFLWNELPIRLAQKVIELENLPYNLSNTPSFLMVKHWYETSFRDIITSLPPKDINESRNFSRVLNVILGRHKNVIPTIAQGILLQKQQIYTATGGLPCPYIKKFLDEFYMSRIAIRMLIAQHIALHKPMPGFCGTIHLELDPIQVVRAAAAEASDLCERTYGATPDIIIHHSTHSTHNLQDVTFPPLSSYNPQIRAEQEENELKMMYAKMEKADSFVDYKPSSGRMTLISSHLHHTMFELLKNSCRATVEYYQGKKSVGEDGQDRKQKLLPDVHVVLSEGLDDITIKISDKGGGIPHQYHKQLFSYLFTTSDAKVQEMLKAFDVSASAQVFQNQHDDHITMLSPPQPVSISAKHALLSLSTSSILQIEQNSMNMKGDTGNSSGANPMHMMSYSPSPPSLHSSESSSFTAAQSHNVAPSINLVLPQDQQHLLRPMISSSATGSSSSFSGPNLSNLSHEQHNLSYPNGINPESMRNPDGIGDNSEDTFKVTPPEEGWGPSAGSGMRLPPISGFGYGLALSSQILKANNGTLQLFTTQGVGTDALIYLPKRITPDQNMF